MAALAILSMTSIAQAGPGFDVVMLGARGGIEDGNLSAFMIAPAGDDRAVTCDAGSLVNGLRVADEKGVFDAVEVPADSPYDACRLRADANRSRAISSATRISTTSSAWSIASPDDAKKPIYGLPQSWIVSRTATSTG